MAEDDDLCARDAVKFPHDIDYYSFDDSVGYRVDFSIESVVLTNWLHEKTILGLL